MAERYFTNEMPKFIPENNLSSSSSSAVVASTSQDSVAKLLSLPYNTLVDKLKTAALHLKQLVSLVLALLILSFYAHQLFDIILSLFV